MRLDTLSLCSLQTTKIYEPLRISITLKYLLLKVEQKIISLTIFMKIEMKYDFGAKIQIFIFSSGAKFFSQFWLDNSGNSWLTKGFFIILPRKFK